MCLFIIMSISVKRHELWCTVRDMRLSKCSIIIIHTALIDIHRWPLTELLLTKHLLTKHSEH